MWLSGKNERTCFKTRPGKGKKAENSDPEWTKSINKWYDKKHKGKRAMQEEKVL
jgi:hypothetical protein